MLPFLPIPLTSPLPPAPTAPFPIHSSISVHKGADLPQVSTKLGISSCDKTKPLPRYESWVRQPSIGIGFQKPAKALGAAPTPTAGAPQVDQATWVPHLCRGPRSICCPFKSKFSLLHHFWKCFTFKELLWILKTCWQEILQTWFVLSRTALCFILIFEAVLDGSRNVGWQLSSAIPLKTSVPAYVVFIKMYYMLTLFLLVNWVFLLGLTSQLLF